MSLQEGGMLWILGYFSVLALLASTGDLQKSIPSLSGALACTPDLTNSGQYTTATIGNNCFDINQDTSFGISGTQGNQLNIGSALISVIPGGRQVGQVLSFFWGILDAVLLKGWASILQAIIGNSPITVLIFWVSIVFQIITDLWILYFFLIILGIVRGGVAVQRV